MRPKRNSLITRSTAGRGAGYSLPFLGVFMLGALFVASGGGCEARVVAPIVNPDTELLVAGTAQRNIDILFVIDNDATMKPWQEQLAAQFPKIASGLALAEGGQPNVHIAVVTTDLGDSGAGYPGCDGEGENDNGTMQPMDANVCIGDECRFIEDVEDPSCLDPNPNNCRRRNYTGSIQDAFSSIALVGENGCRFEQPLEAMRRALNGENPLNDGFRRDEAALVVIFITDGDDCSASDPGIFIDSPEADAALGPLGRLRCFAQGVECAPDEPTTPGVKADCRSRTNSEYIYDVEEYVDFLKGLGGRDQPVFVTVLGGDPTPVEVDIGPEGTPRLQHSCVIPDGVPGGPPGVQQSAGPAIRLHQMVQAFDEFGQLSSLCGQDLDTTLENMATILNANLAGTCLNGELFDSDDLAEGHQPVCEVIQSTPGQEDPVDILPCEANEDVRPCFEYQVGTRRCGDTPTQLSLVIRRDSPPPPGSIVAMACDVQQVIDGYAKESYYGCAIVPGGQRSGPAGWMVLVLGLLLFARATRRRPRRAAAAE